MRPISLAVVALKFYIEEFKSGVLTKAKSKVKGVFGITVKRLKKDAIKERKICTKGVLLEVLI